MNNKIVKNIIMVSVCIFLVGLILPTLIYANSKILADNDEEIICSYVDLDNQNVETDFMKKVDDKTEYQYSSVGYILLGVAGTAFVGKTVYEISCIK